MFTDTHCHLYLEQCAGDIEGVVQRAQEAGIQRMLVPGMDLETSRQAIALAETYESIFAAVGFHPTDAGKMNSQNLTELSRLVEHERVVAIGEIGLDYYWVKDAEQQELQRQNLLLQVELASQVDKPVVLHLREENDAEAGTATDDLLKILKPWHDGLSALKSRPGVFHSFNGNLESAQRAMAMNFCIGVTGPVTYKKNDSHRELVMHLPLDHILIETDSPFQTPLPHRGKHNEPAYVTLIADKIAEVHQTTREAIAHVTTANANRLFRWEANV